ncbi:hypothetical protein LSCM1_02099 [Leishmania martiniquensis]|uniref:Uncharacterized protein n=1 Tax=Leishmania martiniquensis TaxID=1580590 RepID=A0A836KD72_9TRYP|nr:hypothetical protein LSCM1_02099 [Leishmania martiniquensis]
MLAEVYTYARFSSHLSAVLGRHPTATELRLQLLPPVTGPHPGLECRGAHGSRAAVSTLPSIADSDSDVITLYAVLLPHRSGNDSNGNAAAAYPVVGHVSHISLNWCAQLQRSLSITALLAAPSRSFVWHGNGFYESEVSTLLGRERQAGVSSFEVQLSPYVPSLQWHRAVDGIFGSHHSVCSSYTCRIGHWREDDEGAGAAHTRELSEEGGSLRRPPKAPLDAATSDPSLHTPSAGSPTRRPRREGVPEAMGMGTPVTAGVSCCFSSCSGGDLPLRLAAVLNGNVPVDNASSSIPGTRVLCLIALDGALLTGSMSPDPPPLSWQPGLFDYVSNFVAFEVMPRVSLELIDGKWAYVQGSERLLDDVCQVREVLGTSYVVQYAVEAEAPTATRVRSIVLVLDLSVPLQVLLASLSSMRSSSLSSAADGNAASLRRRLAAQFAAAVQDTIGQLVSQHPDVFAFALEDAATTAYAPAAQLSRASTHFTRDMHYRSIAASVTRMFSLSPHPAFREEVVRLLWGPEADVEGIEVAATAERSRKRRRVSQRQPAQIQRCIEERLMSAMPP